MLFFIADYLRQDHKDMHEGVEVAEVHVSDLVLQPVEHILDPLVSAVDGLAQDKDQCEADHEGSLFVFSLF